MFKKIIAVLLVLIISLSLFSCKNENPYTASPLNESVYLSSEVDKKTTLKYDIYEDYAIVTGSIAPLSTLVIPETFNGKEVKAVDKDAFANMTALKALTVSDTVIEIRENAFLGCTGLENIVLSENLYSIGTSAFCTNTSLKSIRIPLSTKVIGGYAFGECTSLKNIVIPKEAVSIGGGAFHETPWLTAQKDEFITAGKDILIHYNGTAKEVTVPDGIVEISAFCENFFVEKINIPESVERIGEYAFLNSSITSITLGTNVKIIGSSAFDGCLNFNKIKFNENIEAIGSYAFSGCQKLEKTSIPKSVTSLGDGVFTRCNGLVELRFDSSKTEIGKDLCESCSSLKKIICPKKSPIIEYAKSEGIRLDII